MTTYVLRPDPKNPGQNILVEKDKAAPLHGRRLHIISDFKDPVKSMVDGKHYGSRRHYRDHLRAHGCVEVGNDFNNLPMRRPEPPPDPTLERDLTRAMEQLK